MNELERFKNDLAKTIFGRERTGDECVSCGSDKINIGDFRDQLSWKEFNISYMCQKCQDDVFGKEE